MSHLRVVSPERVVFDGEVMCVTVPGAMGEFEILEHHAPIISSLAKGHIRWSERNAGCSRWFCRSTERRDTYMC